MAQPTDIGARNQKGWMAKVAGWPAWAMPLAFVAALFIVPALGVAALAILAYLQPEPRADTSPQALPVASRDNRPTAIPAQQATMAKMSDRQLLDSASTLLAGKNVSEIPVAHENEAAMYLREFSRRHPQSKDARAQRIGERLVTVTLARNMVARAAQMDANPPSDWAQATCRAFVRLNLKAPDSADFQSGNDDYVKYLGKGKFHIQTKAAATNSFGAKLLNTFDCKVQCLAADNCSVTSMSEID